MVIQLYLLLLLHILHLCQVILSQGLNLNRIPLMDLRSDLVSDVLVQMLDFLENTSLQFGACACALGKFIFTIMIDAPFTACFGPEFLNNAEFLLKHLLEIEDFSL